ncbi:hypothetical protein ACIOWB_24240 [Pseudomonas capeferrum]|uniref:hypothetical protein n=1 Tax=Pseudomonas capeferrum TaxID=1495066 RepID=UPI0037F3F71C
MQALACDFYDLIKESGEAPSRDHASFFFETLNRAAVNDVYETETVIDEGVYTHERIHGKIGFMSIFRKDLFVSITLPVCVVVCGAYAFTWTSFTRVDDANRAVLQAVSEQGKFQAVSTEQISNLSKLQQETNAKLDKIGDQLGTLNTSFEVLKAGQKQAPES